MDEANESEILGFFTLSNHSILLTAVPKEFRKRLPRYPSVGTILLGRMGRNFNSTPAGFGEIILKDAMKQSLQQGSFFALELHAKNERLANYYERIGFIKLVDNDRHLILPYPTLAKAVNG